ncbi:MAG: hypothetical protein IKH76_10155, partial [Clostridiales bacterium]|nr:hypothetical protein [Clostridiales bacterium]
MKVCRKSLALLLSFVIAMSVIVCPAMSKDSMALESTGNSTFDAFINDARWTNGISWGARSPKISSWSSSGCCAYCADFVKYCFGNDSPSSGTPFYSESEIRAGDVIFTGGHWFAVLKRSGNSLYVAEGNFDSVVRIGWNYSAGSIGMAVGYHYSAGTSNRQPIGCINCKIVNNNQLNMAGWAFDPDEPSKSIAVHVYVNETFVYGFAADKYSPDVNDHYGISGKHRFDETIDLYTYGNLTITLYGIDSQSGGNPKLGEQVNQPKDYSITSTKPSLTYATIDAIPDQEYTGSAICPSFTVRY